MKNSGKYFPTGTSLTSESFVLDSLVFFRMLKTDCLLIPVGDWKDAPVNNKTIQTNIFCMYNMQTQVRTYIEARQYFTALQMYRDNGGLSEVDEEYVYDKVLDDNFVMYCLGTSEYM